ncbi:MAG: hypothetical protein Q8P27_00590, partial [Candidatus Peregrinibacteria bacterium]|nr:hypothetical protein [Candidatus Peregrinibacteria bacterium]
DVYWDEKAQVYEDRLGYLVDQDGNYFTEDVYETEAAEPPEPELVPWVGICVSDFATSVIVTTFDENGTPNQKVVEVDHPMNLQNTVEQILEQEVYDQ